MTLAEALGWYGYVLASSEPKLAEPHKPHVYTTWRSFQYQMAIQASELNTGMKAPTPAQVPKLGVGNAASQSPCTRKVAGCRKARAVRVLGEPVTVVAIWATAGAAGAAFSQTCCRQPSVSKSLQRRRT